jgi:hypothetical protein
MEKTTGALRPPRIDCWAGRLAGYWPKGIDAGVWDQVRSFVVGCLDRLDVEDGPGARRVVRVLAGLTAWAIGDGLPLDFEVVLDPDTVERFIAVGVPDDRSRATYRSVLRRVGPKLTAKAPWEPGVVAVGRRQVARPYSVAEISQLRTDALAQPTPGRVRAARALLALGAGAGLDGRWVAKVSATDVQAAGEMVSVRVGEPSARVVPVLVPWEDEVVDLAEAAAAGEFLVGGTSLARNRAGALAASLVVAHGHPRFSTSRLRSTWLVGHLTLGTRLPELVRAAGLRGVTVLSDLLEFVPAVDEKQRIEMLRGRS